MSPLTLGASGVVEAVDGLGGTAIEAAPMSVVWGEKSVNLHHHWRRKVVPSSSENKYVHHQDDAMLVVEEEELLMVDTSYDDNEKEDTSNETAKKRRRSLREINNTPEASELARRRWKKAFTFALSLVRTKGADVSIFGTTIGKNMSADVEVDLRKKLSTTAVNGSNTQTVRRVGVPGGDKLDFDSVHTIMSWYGSSFQAAFTSWMTFLHLFVFAALTAAAIYADVKLVFPSAGMSIFRFTATFNLVFYSGRCLARYEARFQDMCKTMGAATLVTSLCSAHIGSSDKRAAASIIRYSAAMLHINFLICGGLDDEKWNLIAERGVLTWHEIAVLKNSEGKSLLVHTWVVRIVRGLQRAGILTDMQSESITKFLGMVRGLSAKQIAYSVTTLPKPYFHLATALTHTYVILESISAAGRIGDAYALHADDGPCAVDPDAIDCDGSLTMVSASNAVLQVCVIITLVSMWRVCVWLSDPVGDDVTDYDLDFDLRNNWMQGLEAITQLKYSKHAGLDVHDRVIKRILPHMIEADDDAKSSASS